jgi:hypothetical protein
MVQGMTTLCPCRAVRQSSTERQHTWPEVMAEIVAMCKSYVEWATVHRVYLPSRLAARHGNAHPDQEGRSEAVNRSGAVQPTQAST